MTGFMWRDATRYQHNVAINDRLVGLIQRPRRLSLSYVQQPLPVYWVEKSSTINAAGVDDFYSRVCKSVFASYATPTQARFVTTSRPS